MPISTCNCCHKKSCNTFHVPMMLSRSISVQPTLLYTPMHAQTILYTNNCCTDNNCCTYDCCDNSDYCVKEAKEEKLIKQETVHASIIESDSVSNKSIVNAELIVDAKINEAKKRMENYENEAILSRLREEDLRKRLAALEAEQSKYQAKTSCNAEVSTHIQGSQTKETSLNKKCCCSLSNDANHCDYCSSHYHGHYSSYDYADMEEKLRHIRNSVNSLLPDDRHRLMKRETVKTNKSENDNLNSENCQYYEFDTVETILRPKSNCFKKVNSKPPWKITGILNSAWENRHKNTCRPSSELEIASTEKMCKKNKERITLLSTTGKNEHNQYEYHEIPIIYTRNNLKNEIKSIRPRSKSYHRNCAKNSDYCWRLKLDELENSSKTSGKYDERIVYSYKASRPNTSVIFNESCGKRNYYDENLPQKIELIRNEIKSSSSCPATEYPNYEYYCMPKQTTSTNNIIKTEEIKSNTGDKKTNHACFYKTETINLAPSISTKTLSNGNDSQYVSKISSSTNNRIKTEENKTSYKDGENLNTACYYQTETVDLAPIVSIKTSSNESASH